MEDITLIPENIGEAGIENEVVIPPESMDEVLKDKDLKVAGPFRVHYIVEREKDSDTIHVFIDVEGKIEAACARCLEAVTHGVDLHIETDYMPAPPDMPENLEEERISSETGYYRKIVRLGSFIVSELVLGLPLRFICDEGCQGLCSGCGVNLNREACRCEAPGDPRMKKLADLKDKIRRK